MSSLHRAGLCALGLLGVSAAVAACAGSDEDATALPPEDAGGSETTVPDVDEGGAPDAGGDTNAPAADACTSAGWCSLGVDRDLSFRDLWPLENGSAVALAFRDGRTQVTIYDGAFERVIYEVPFRLTSVWATGSEVWVSGGEPGYVAHGHGGPENPEWAWTVRSIDVPAPVDKVWGTGDGELYALADKRVWRLANESSDWTVDFGGDTPAGDTTLVTLTGTGGSDVWLTGSRGSFPPCGFVAHKTGGSWEMLVEGTPDPTNPWPWACVPVSEAITVHGPATIAAATAPRELVTVVEDSTSYYVARIRHLADGSVDMARADLGMGFSYPRDRASLWGASADDLYLAGFSKVMRGRNLWTDAGGWAVSTVAFEGIALVKPFHVVRGTKSDDIWLAGDSYVFHKTID